jgi:hypothetical protein
MFRWHSGCQGIFKHGVMNRVEKADIFEANVQLYQQLMAELVRLEEERDRLDQ